MTKTVRRPRQDLTIRELRRMKELADIGIPCGSVGKLVSHEFGTDRNATDVRRFLRRYYEWRSPLPARGRPFA